MNITEGQINTSVAEQICYPEVNTCLTLTCVYSKNGATTIAGAHFSKPLPSGDKMDYPRPHEIVSKLKTLTGTLGEMTKAFVIGNRGVWSLEDVKPLHEFATPAIALLEFEEVDTAEYKGVNIYVDFTGTITIKQAAATSGSLAVKDGAIMKTLRWKD
jgi:hypothetical protein